MHPYYCQKGKTGPKVGTIILPYEPAITCGQVMQATGVMGKPFHQHRDRM